MENNNQNNNSNGGGGGFWGTLIVIGIIVFLLYNLFSCSAQVHREYHSYDNHPKIIENQAEAFQKWYDNERWGY